MADFPAAVRGGAQTAVIGTGQLYTEELTMMNTNLTTWETQTGAWPSSNLAIFIPFTINAPFTATQMWVCNGGTVSGNIDVGIYDLQGTKLVSKGSTAQAGTSSNQTFDITDTLLNPGVYYMAVAMDNGTGIVWHFVHPATNSRMFGVCQMATAFALPATATYAAMAQAYIPEVFITGSTVI